jgi:hypothetical protein
VTRYWLTTHWPPRGGDDGEGHRHVWLPDGRQSAGRDMRPGDKVLIYESKSGRTEITQNANGDEIRIRCLPGKQGIVTVGDIQREMRSDGRNKPTKYVGGRTVWWRWKALTCNEVEHGFVRRQDVNRILGYSESNPLRGFGDAHSGLKELEKEEYEKLLSAFKRGASSSPISETGELPPPGRSFEGGGESVEHRNLKEYVAEHPSLVWGEPDVIVSHVKTEYPFVTGDRADVVLRDDIGRIIGVEIELEQRDGQHDGILQAIKYRHMLALMFRLRFAETRSLLVAYGLSETAKKLCEEYAVEWRVIDRDTVNRWQHQRLGNHSE